MYILESKDLDHIKYVLLNKDILKAINPKNTPIPTDEQFICNPVLKWLITYIDNRPSAYMLLKQLPDYVDTHFGILEGYRDQKLEIFLRNKQFIQKNYPDIKELTGRTTIKRARMFFLTIPGVRQIINNSTDEYIFKLGL